MFVKVNSKRCQGHNRCGSLAPELFDTDEFGMAFPLYHEMLPPELEEKARLAADNCPEYAVLLKK